MKPRKRRAPFWIAVAGVVLSVALFLAYLQVVGIRPSRVRRSEELTARIEREDAELAAAKAKTSEQAKKVTPAAPLAQPASTSSPTPFEKPPGGDLIRQMFEIYKGEVLLSPDREKWFALLGKTTYGASYFTNVDYAGDLTRFLEIHKENLDRIEQVYAHADEWDAVRQWAVQSFAAPDPSAKGKILARFPWDGFEDYLFHLVLFQIHFASAGNTQELARGFVAAIPLALAMKGHQTAPNEDRFALRQWSYWQPFPSRLYNCLENTLREGPAFHRGDWAGLDWSALLRLSWKPPDTFEFRKNWDEAAARAEADYLKQNGALPDRFHYHYTNSIPAYLFWGTRFALASGRLADEMTEWREKGHQFIGQPRTYEEIAEFFRSMPVMKRRVYQGGASTAGWLSRFKGEGTAMEESLILPDPMEVYLQGSYEDANMHLLDAALRLLRGEVIPEKPESGSPFFVMGRSLRITRSHYDASRDAHFYTLALDYDPPHRKLANHSGPFFDQGIYFKSAEPLVQPVDLESKRF